VKTTLLDWYRRAERRVEREERLTPYREDLLREWNLGAAHYEWVATAEIRDVLDWAVAAHEADQINRPRRGKGEVL